MGWSSDFRDALNNPARSGAMLFRLVFYPHSGGVSRGSILTGVPGDPAGPLSFQAGAPSMSGTSVAPGSWSVSWGSCSIEVQGDQFLAVLPELRRGATAAVFAGFVGWDLADFQRVFLGTLRNVTGNGRNRWRVELWDLLAGYRTRQTTEPGNWPDPANPSQFPLFWDLGKPVTLTAKYNPGDPSLFVSDPDPFNVDSQWATLGGLAKVTPSGSSASGAFYVPFTSKFGAALNGVPAAPLPGYPWAPATPFACAAAGSEVQPVAWLRGHPVDIATRLLTSSIRSNGIHDTLPSAWSFRHGIPQDWIDLGDMAIQEALVILDKFGTANGYHWEIIQEEPVDDGMGWLQSYLSAAGIWLLQRQGVLTVRAAQDTEDAGGLQPFGVRMVGNVTLERSDLDAYTEPTWTAWSPGQTYAAGACSVKTFHGQKGRSVGRVDTLPAVDVVQHDLSGVLRAASWSNMADGDLVRLQKWDTGIAEVLDVSLVMSSRTAGLVAGDVVRLNWSHLRGRLPSTRYGFVNREAMALSVSPDFGGRLVRAQFAVQPYLHELPTV